MAIIDPWAAGWGTLGWASISSAALPHGEPPPGDGQQKGPKDREPHDAPKPDARDLGGRIAELPGEVREKSIGDEHCEQPGSP